MSSSSSYDDDEWGAAELDIPDRSKEGNQTQEHDDAAAAADDDDDEWMSKTPASSNKSSDAPEGDGGGKPMILIDLTRLNPKIHNKFDKDGVSDSAAASDLRKKIESQYEQYSNDAKLLADGTIVPCSTSVWRGAIQRMRDERPGHYFAPIFPPPLTKKS